MAKNALQTCNTRISRECLPSLASISPATHTYSRSATYTVRVNGYDERRVSPIFKTLSGRSKRSGNFLTVARRVKLKKGCDQRKFVHLAL